MHFQNKMLGTEICLTFIQSLIFGLKKTQRGSKVSFCIPSINITYDVVFEKVTHKMRVIRKIIL